MAHTLIRSPISLWTDGSTILGSELTAFDARLTACVNGDDGGCYAPATPIIIGGSGCNVTGPTVIARGGVLQTTGSSGALAAPTIRLSDGDNIEFDPGNPFTSYKRLVSCALGRGLPQYTWTVRRESGALQAYSAMYDLSDGAGPQVARAYVPIRAHDGATLTSLQVFFRVATEHSAIPTTMPSVRVVRVDAFGAVAPLTSTAAGGDANGYVYAPTPSSAEAWDNNFTEQSLTIPCDQNNVLDVGTYGYLVELVEEQGLTGYPWVLVYAPPVLAATTANISPSGTSITVDGVTLGAGDTVLVKDQNDAALNGILVAGSGPWPRAPFLTMTQGLVVPVLNAGPTNALTFWQLQTFITDWAPGSGVPLIFLPKVDAANPAEGDGFFAHGTLWQSMLMTFSAIADMRAP